MLRTFANSDGSSAMSVKRRRSRSGGRRFARAQHLSYSGEREASLAMSNGNWHSDSGVSAVRKLHAVIIALGEMA